MTEQKPRRDGNAPDRRTYTVPVGPTETRRIAPGTIGEIASPAVAAQIRKARAAAEADAEAALAETMRNATLPSGLAAVCDTPRCPTPDHGNHYHCGRCNSADITSMYGHAASPRGCPTPLAELPAALRRHVELHDGMSAWPVPPVLDGPVADARLWAARPSLHGPPGVPHTVWAYLGDTLVSYRGTTPEGIADLQAAVDRRTAGDGPAPRPRGWADLYLPPGYGDREDEAFMLLAELVDDGEPPFGASAVAALRRSARTAMRLLSDAGHAGRPDDYGIE